MFPGVFDPRCLSRVCCLLRRLSFARGATTLTNPSPAVASPLASRPARAPPAPLQLRRAEPARLRRLCHVCPTAPRLRLSLCHDCLRRSLCCSQLPLRCATWLPAPNVCRVRTCGVASCVPCRIIKRHVSSRRIVKRYLAIISVSRGSVGSTGHVAPIFETARGVPTQPRLIFRRRTKLRFLQ